MSAAYCRNIILRRWMVSAADMTRSDSNSESLLPDETLSCNSLPNSFPDGVDITLDLASAATIVAGASAGCCVLLRSCATSQVVLARVLGAWDTQVCLRVPRGVGNPLDTENAVQTSATAITRRAHSAQCIFELLPEWPNARIGIGFPRVDNPTPGFLVWDPTPRFSIVGFLECVLLLLLRSLLNKHSLKKNVGRAKKTCVRSQGVCTCHRRYVRSDPR